MHLCNINVDLPSSSTAHDLYGTDIYFQHKVGGVHSNIDYEGK